MRGCTRCDGESNSSLATGAVTRYSSHSLADAVCFLKGEERGGRTRGRTQEDRSEGDTGHLYPRFDTGCSVILGGTAVSTQSTRARSVLHEVTLQAFQVATRKVNCSAHPLPSSLSRSATMKSEAMFVVSATWDERYLLRRGSMVLDQDRSDRSFFWTKDRSLRSRWDCKQIMSS